MNKLKHIAATLLLCIGGGNTAVAQVWEDYTSKITNPSFESDEASSNLKSSGWGTGTGWTITPSSQPANSQSGIANASTVLQGIGDTFSPTDGDKYMYIRCNWQASTEFKVAQKLAASSGLPKGTYRLSCSVANFSSSYYKTTYKLSLSDGTNTASNTSFYSKQAWKPMSIVFYKSDDATDLTIEAYMKPGAADGGQHYCLLVDNFKLEYLSDSELENASESNPFDLTAAISNANIYNETKTSCPKGWSCPVHTAGNSNYTEGTGDTQLEGWSGGTMNVHYTQILSNLPNGKYIVKAKVHDSNDKGAVLYATSSSTTVTGDMGKDYAVVSTDVISITDKTLTIGVKGENIGGTWMTGDDFQVFFVGIDLSALHATYSSLQSEAEALLANAVYVNVTGSERTALEAAKGVTPEEKKTALETAISNLQAAMNTFKAAKTSYDNFVEEKATADKFSISIEAPTSAADAVAKMQQLNVDEYTKVTGEYTTSIELGSWTTSGAANFDNEHWSGTKRSYLNQDDSNGKGWNSNSWTMTCEQTITLPAGEYVFKAAGRKSTNAHLNLVVKNGETTIGTVSNFPNGNVGLGITTDGEASFDAGKTYANSNKGYGWQWRFVPFTLDAETSITFTIDAGSDILHNWASFGDYTVMAKPSLVASKSAYSQVCANADVAIAAFPVDACAEIAAVNTAKTVSGETIEAYDNATLAVTAAVEALAAVKAKYQTLVDAKNAAQEELPYALASKYTAITTAKAVETTSETTATDAETYTANITSALRAYYESNGKAEGVTGAVDCTDKVANADFSDGLNGWTSSQGGGALQTLNGETWTNADGSAGGHYYDYNNDGANNQHGYQTVTGLVPGKYIVTLKARAKSGFYLYMYINDEQVVDIKEIGNTGGVFNRGWNDYTAEFVVDKAGSVKIEVANTPPSNRAGWFGFGDVRLVKIGELDAVTLDETTNNTITEGVAKVTLKRTIVADVWNTLVLPFDMTNEEVGTVFGAGAQVAEFSNTEGVNVNFDTTEEGIKANTPVLLKADAATEFSFNGYTLVVGEPKAAGTEYDFVGSYDASYNLNEGEYMLNGSKFWKESGEGYYIKGFRAYLKAKAPSAAKSLNLVIDGQTTGLKLNTVTGDVEGETYNIAGQKVTDTYKGIVIMNGRKTVRK